MATPFNPQNVVQPIAQGNTPFLSNNGNPGTVYNIPHTGGYVPPQSTAYNQWAVNPIQAPAPFWQNTGAAAGPRPGIALPVITNPGWTGVPPTAPPVTPPTTPVTVSPPPSDPLIPPSAPGDPGRGVTTPIGRVNGGTYNPSIDGLGGVSLTGTSGSNFRHTIPRSGGFGGVAASLGGGNGFSWQQMLDAVLPGDLYDSQSGKWDITNIVAEALNLIAPGMGTAAQWLNDQGVLGQPMQDFQFNESMRQFESRFDRNAAESAQRTSEVLSNRTAQSILDRADMRLNAFKPGGLGWTGLGQPPAPQLGTSPFDSQYNGTINDRMNQWGPGGGAPARDSRSGGSVGSGVVATGTAAQDMVGDMQLNQSLNGTAQQANLAHRNMFRNAQR